ncbi:glycosyltransferase [Marichromatium gracile]|uniref:glycosyltransferase n=1 Tax=Marichromatium gracile TaxID=1048 RepID=UPI001F308BC3|nr:glycosyltransferase [Marichromatium gracile]MCF1183819.1 glycosyltransferase [Marichromatium gracile]
MATMAMPQGVSRLLDLVRRYGPRALHVLRTEGPRVLARKLARRLRTTPLRIPDPPVLLAFDEPFEPIALPAPEHPRVSVVIPIHGQFGYTHHCLAALARCDDTARFEVVVVDDCSPDDSAARLAAYPGVRLIRNPENLGFVGTCNRGAEAARGELLVFLNNDTQVQPGWLDALLATFDDYPDAGMVGARLVYPDGRQQEAGGILFADGSAWNHGHLDDPHRPEYGYVRPVDYCSGAALAIPRALFERLDGFDRTFAPAYYEDTDLAMRVRAAGLRVYYQPAAWVVHFEGVSAGRDPEASSGLKRYQRIHAETFRARWGETLAGFGARDAALDRVKDRALARRALVVDNYMVTPDRESGSLRMVNLFAILRGLGYQVTFAAANLEAPEPYVGALQQRGVEVLYRPHVPSVARHLATQGARYDLVVLSRADAAAALMEAARRHCARARIVFDTVDLHFLRERRLAELRGDAATRRIAARRRDQELALMRRADQTWVVSEAERALLATEAPDVEVHLVSNIHRIFGSARPAAERHGLLFIGAFAHPPNTDAVLFLGRELMPLLRERLPGVVLRVVGAEPPPEVRALAAPDIEILGYVPDVAPLFASSRASVAPLRYGAGVKGKINQSLAHGLPVVATAVAAEGMHLVDGESVLLGEDARALADAIARVCVDDALWQRLSDGGLAVMERHFGFAAAERAVRVALDEEVSR